MTAIPAWRRRWRGRALQLEATLALSVAALALRLLPFRHAARLLIGRASAVDGGPPPLPAGPDPPPDEASLVAWAVTRASRRLPFPTLCLREAMAARLMLARRGHATTLHLSVRMGGGAEAAAHAWLTLGGQVVIGGGRPDGQAEIVRFR
ncbi:lasso peptide biosynthesis B2 protein [Roseomonas stagni]|uniref:Lasso peptide biosynthesis B2 protein n=1 Tax=Falsiroseomonas algicola TaxID=2716930 RepID=A0A6M1LVI1_9PROT|nr:lasso peptide biosynthesis B2 protein [Falsiroseomonas algicola]NGM24197.1 lasso peptide biosynthesis B2 protein [Falsiroseomonas algicola]